MVCVLTTRHYVLQSVSVLDPNYVILIIARVACLSTAGAHTTYPADTVLVSRHDSFLKELIFHALSSAGISSNKESTGLSHCDGKRPDGLTLTPWQAWKNAIWNVTVTDTLAMSYLNSTSITAGCAAEQASARKEEKYAVLALSHIFTPIAIETMGPIGSKASSILHAGAWSSPFSHNW